MKQKILDRRNKQVHFAAKSLGDRIQAYVAGKSGKFGFVSLDRIAVVFAAYMQRGLICYNGAGSDNKMRGELVFMTHKDTKKITEYEVESVSNKSKEELNKIGKY